MQTKQQTWGGVDDGDFQPIPTRIRDLPPLIVEPEGRIASETDTEVIAKLAELSHSLAHTHRATAEAYLSQARYEEALAHVNAAATFAPEIKEYHNQLGFLRYLQGDDHGAVQSFERVLGMEPANPDALFNLGMVMFGREDYATAEDCFRRSIQARPDEAEAWNNRGVCLHKIGHPAEARTCFERALQIEPQNEDAQANLGLAGV